MSDPRFLRLREGALAVAVCLSAAALPTSALPRIPLPEQRINVLVPSTVADHRRAAMTTTDDGAFTLLAYLENGSVYGRVRHAGQSSWQATDPLDGPGAGNDPVVEFQMAPTVDSAQNGPTVLIASRTINPSRITISLLDRNGVNSLGANAVIAPPDGLARELRLATWDQRAALCFVGGNKGQTYCSFSAETGSGGWSAPRLMSTQAGVLNTQRVAAAYDHAGRLFVAWAETTEALRNVFVATSLDNGSSFGPPSVFAGSPFGFDELHLVVANDDSAIVAYFDSSSSYTNFYRTANHGSSWQLNLQEFATDSSSDFALVPDSGGSGMLYAGTTYPDGLRVRRSNDHGASWEPAQVLNSSTHIPFSDDYLGARVLAASAEPGVYLLAWADDRAAISVDKYETRVYVRSTADGGDTWGPELRVDDPTVEALSDPLLLAFREEGWDLIIGDGTDTSSRSEQLHLARITRDAGSTSTGPFQIPKPEVPARIDPGYTTRVATDNASLGLIAFSASVASAPPDVYVARSTDRGRTFSVASLASGGTPGAHRSLPQSLIAPSASQAYLLYAAPSTRSGRGELRLVRSPDGGQSWDTANETVLSKSANGEFCNGRANVLVGSPDNPNRVAAWLQECDQNQFLTIHRKVSTDGGLTFPSEWSFGPYRQDLIDQDNVHACYSAGSQGFPELDVGVWTARPPFSPSPPTIYTSFGESFEGEHPAVACRPVYAPVEPRAVLVYSAGGQIRVRKRSYAGGGWQLNAQVLSPAGAACGYPQVVYLNSSTITLVTYSCQRPGGYDFYSTRSVNNGAFSPPLLIASTPWNVWFADHTLLGDDPGTNAWMITDRFPSGSIAVSLSRDAGGSWEPLLRAEEPPEEAVYNYPRFGGVRFGAAFPGRALISWSDARLDQAANALANVYDAFDTDLDGTSYTTDCDDLDPTPMFPPGEVTGVEVVKYGSGNSFLRVSWASQNPPNPTVSYDVVTQSLSELRSSGGYAPATCRLNDGAANYFEEPVSGSPPGDGRLWLVRAKTGCGVGSYGTSVGSGSNARALLDGPTGPCP